MTEQRLRVSGVGVLLGAVALLAGSTVAVAAPPPEISARDGSSRPLVVALAEGSPFAIRDADGAWSGLSVELWREIAAGLELRWEPLEIELEQVDSVLRDGRADAALGTVAIDAEGEVNHDFSLPYLSAGLGFAQRATDELSWRGMLGGLLRSDLLRLMAVIAAAILLVGALIAVIERRQNTSQFGGPLGQGIATGVWWAAVTMTTVGYGDATPKTASGRSLALIWMFVGVAAVAIFTAMVTSILTVGSLRGAAQHEADLFRLRLAAVGGSAGAEFLSRHSVGFAAADTYDQALAELAAGRVDAVVANIPALRYLVSHRWQGTLRVSPVILEPVSYAIALPTASPLRESINRALLRIIEQDRWRDVEHQYLGHS